MEKAKNNYCNFLTGHYCLLAVKKKKCWKMLENDFQRVPTCCGRCLSNLLECWKCWNIFTQKLRIKSKILPTIPTRPLLDYYY